MAKFIPYATTAVEAKPYSEGFMWVDRETGRVRFDVDGISIYAASGATDYNVLENQPVYNFSDLAALQTALATQVPIYFKWSGASGAIIGETALETGVIYFASNASTLAAITGAMPDMPDMDYDQLANTPIINVASLDYFTADLSYPVYFRWVGAPVEQEGVTLVAPGSIYFLAENTTVPKLVGESVSDYLQLANKPIEEANLNDPTISVEAGKYYINKVTFNDNVKENPTEPNSTSPQTVSELYFNTDMSAAKVGDYLLKLDWEHPFHSMELADPLQFISIQLLGKVSSYAEGCKGIYANRHRLESGAYVYYISNSPIMGSTDRILYFIWADAVAPAEVGLDEIEDWGWGLYNTESGAVQTLPTPVTLAAPFDFKVMADKECWDSWLSTTDTFASERSYLDGLLYYSTATGLNKLDGNVVEPVVRLAQPTQNDLGRVVFNQADNILYRCDPSTEVINEAEINFLLLEDIESVGANWENVESLNTIYFNSKEFDSSAVDALLLASASLDVCGSSNGRLLQYYLDSTATTKYTALRFSGDISTGVWQILDETDTCSPKVLYNSATGGWTDLLVNEGSCLSYTFNQELYRPSLYSERDGFTSYFYSGLLSPSPETFEPYPVRAKGPYCNIWENPTCSEVFTADTQFATYGIGVDSNSNIWVLQMMLANAGDILYQSDQSGLVFTAQATPITGDDSRASTLVFYSEIPLIGTDLPDAPEGWNPATVDLTTAKILLPNSSGTPTTLEMLTFIPVGSYYFEPQYVHTGRLISGAPFKLLEGLPAWKQVKLPLDAISNVDQLRPKLAPEMFAKPVNPIDVMESGSYASIYVNKYFPKNYSSEYSLSERVLLTSQEGTALRMDYTAQTPDSLHLYVTDSSNSGANTITELYKDGSWQINVDTPLAGQSYWRYTPGSSYTAEAVSQLISFSSKNGSSTDAVYSADEAWKYISAGAITDVIIPPNLGRSAELASYNSSSLGASLVYLDSSSSTHLYQCVYEGPVSLSATFPEVSATIARVAFKPIWSSSSTNAITCVSETIGTSQITLFTCQYSGSTYMGVLVDGAAPTSGTLYWKRLFN